MHAKSWVLDSSVLFIGSVNFTHNSLDKSKENMMRTTEPSAVADALADYEQLWRDSTPVTYEILEAMLEAQCAAKERKSEKQAEDRAARARSRASASSDDAGRSRPSEEETSQGADASAVRRSHSERRSVSRSLSAELQAADAEHQ